jgi:hypothetical protein
MKVCNLYRLLSKKDNVFNFDGQKETVRTGVVISQSYIDETNASSENSGMRYEIDEEATKERDNSFKETKEPRSTTKETKEPKV